MQTTENIWKKITDYFEKNLSEETFNLWIKPIKPLGIKENSFIIEVPNKFFANWIEQNHKKNIENIISEIFPNKINLEYKYVQDLDTILKTKMDTELPEEINVNVQTEFNPKYTFDSFVEGASNRFAKAACLAAANNPGKEYNPIFIYGGVGLGKTHLLHAIGNKMISNNPKLRICYISSEKFINEFIESLKSDTAKNFRNKFRTLDCLLLDDIQFLIDKERSQEEFFYTFNALFDSQKQIIITSDRPPKELSNIQERLINRFEWGVVADVKIPELETRIAILRKKIETEKIFVPDDVILFLASRIKTNIRELEGSLIRIFAFSNLTGTPLTVDVAKEILNDILRVEEQKKPITIERIQEIVAKHYHIDVKELKSKKRSDMIALPRQIAMYLARTLTEMSTIKIGEFFDGKDHTTVMHACNKIRNKMNSDTFFVAEINKIIQKIRSFNDENNSG